MISKALRGSDISGLLRYLFGPGRAEEHTNQRIVAASDPTWIGTTALDGQTLRQLIAELHDPVTRHGDSTKAGYVYHVAVAVPCEDGALSDARWRAAAQRFAAKLGFDDEVRWVAINHGRSVNGNDHIHLVANLIRDDGRAARLPFDRMRRRETCLELEEQFGLTATAAAGRGEPGSLSRHEVEQVRSGAVADVSDLRRHRIATVVRAVAAGARSEPEFVERLRGEGLVVRARQDKGRDGVVTGYSVAERNPVFERGANSRLIWFGGGRLGRDLRLPALRTAWHQSNDQRSAAGAAWFSEAAQRRTAEPRNLIGAADALRLTADALQCTPPGDRDSWNVVVTESAGLLAAAANCTPDGRLRRDLTKAWQAVTRATPDEPNSQRTAPASPTSPEPDQTTTETTAAISTWLGGTSRVLMAAKPTDSASRTRVQALLVQAIELAAQIASTIAAQRDSTAAQQRAAAATERALQTATTSVRPVGWQFVKSGAEVLDAARDLRSTGGMHVADQPRPLGLDHGLTDGNDPGR